MKTAAFYVVLLSLLALVGCANKGEDKNKSYVLKIDNTCEGSPLTVSEQVSTMQQVTTQHGLSCFTQPTKIPNGEMIHRALCVAPQGLVPIGNITSSKRACESAKKIVVKNPEFGLEAYQRQSEEEAPGFWVVGLREKVCLHYPANTIEEMVTDFKKETGEKCQVKEEDIPGETVRTISCGPESAWMVTESEETCQMVIMAMPRNV